MRAAPPLCILMVLAAVARAEASPVKAGKTTFPLCGVLRAYSAKDLVLVVPKSLREPEVRRFDVDDKTHSERFTGAAPWWVCVTRGKIVREARGSLSDGTQGKLVAEEFGVDQTMLEMGGE